MWGLCAPTPRTPFLSLCFWARQRERNRGKKEKPRHNRLITTKLNLRRTNSLNVTLNLFQGLSMLIVQTVSAFVAVSLSGDYLKLRALRAHKNIYKKFINFSMIKLLFQYLPIYKYNSLRQGSLRRKIYRFLRFRHLFRRQPE